MFLAFDRLKIVRLRLRFSQATVRALVEEFRHETLASPSFLWSAILIYLRTVTVRIKFVSNTLYFVPFIDLRSWDKCGWL